MRLTILVILIATLTFTSSPAQLSAEDAQARLLATLADPTAPAEQTQAAVSKLLDMKLSAVAQAQVAEYCVSRLTGPSGSLQQIPRVLRVLTKFKEIPADQQLRYATSIAPLMKAAKMPNGDMLGVADRCGLAAALYVSDPSNREGIQFLIDQAKQGQTTAYLMISACQATEGIPILLQRLRQAETKPEQLALIMSLGKMSLDGPASKEVQSAIAELSPAIRQVIQQRIKLQPAKPIVN